MSAYISPIPEDQQFQKNQHVFQDQISLFDADADFWWKQGGPFDLLHEMNPLRLRFINECVGHLAQNQLTPSALNPKVSNESPLNAGTLAGLKILDIGCGGGILSEPLARLGADVTGIDASEGAIIAAKKHAEMMGLTIDYLHTTIDDFSEMNQSGMNQSGVGDNQQGFDLIIASEIIEHVPNPASFLMKCAENLKPNSKGIVLSTINRTLKSYVGAIVGAEYVLRLVPRGTHDWNRFLKPSEIADMGFKWKELRGLFLNPCRRQWSFTQDLSINYIGWLVPTANAG